MRARGTGLFCGLFQQLFKKVLFTTRRSISPLCGMWFWMLYQNARQCPALLQFHIPTTWATVITKETQKVSSFQSLKRHFLVTLKVNHIMSHKYDTEYVCMGMSIPVLTMFRGCAHPKFKTVAPYLYKLCRILSAVNYWHKHYSSWAT